MNFIQAIIIASAGFNIRRKVWAENENCYLCLTPDKQLYWAYGNLGGYCQICPANPDISVDLLPEDVNATDWEQV